MMFTSFLVLSTTLLSRNFLYQGFFRAKIFWNWTSFSFLGKLSFGITPRVKALTRLLDQCLLGLGALNKGLKNSQNYKNEKNVQKKKEI